MRRSYDGRRMVSRRRTTRRRRRRSQEEEPGGGARRRELRGCRSRSCGARSGIAMCHEVIDELMSSR